jgi:hypothetical protein
MRRPSRIVLLLLVCLACLTPPAVVAADPAPAAWPVRFNLSMPFGYTFGHDQVHGFTWGLRSTLNVYPTRRGPGIGAYGEWVIDTQTNDFWTLGGTGSLPVHRFDTDTPIDLRVGGYAGWRTARNDDDNRVAAGVFTSLEVPAYPYDFRIGLRLDGTFHDGKWSAGTIALDVDIAAIIALIGSAYGK